MPTSNVDIVLRAKDEATATLKRLSGSMEGLSGIASKFASSMGVGALAGGTFAASAAAAVTMISSMAVRLSEQVEQLDNVSASTGIATERLQVLQFAFRQGGVDAGALTQGLSFMTRALENNAEKLVAMGVTSRDTFTAFMQLAQIISSTTDVAKRNALVFEVFGRGGMQLVPVLDDLATNYDKLAESAERSGVALNESQLQTMRSLDAASDQLSAAVSGLSNELVLTFAPAVITVANVLTEMLSVMQEIGREASNEQVKSDMEDWAARMRGERRSRGGGAADDQPWWSPSDYDYQTPPPVMGPIQQLPSPSRWLPDFGTWGSDPFFGIGPKPDILGNLGVGRLVEEVQPVLDEAAKAFLEFSETVRGAFNEIGAHVYSGFYTVLMNLQNRMQTFASAWETLWQSIVVGFQSAMAQIISSAMTSGFLKLLGIVLTAVTGNAAFVMAGDAASGGPIDLGSPVVSGPVGAGGGSIAAARGGDTFYIQTFSAKDLLTSLVSPHGELRSANSRLIEIAAAS